MSEMERQLTPRQVLILLRVVREYISTGHPVGSKALVDSGAVDASASTVRYELAELEALGLLGHPHTSAGRVPTDAGYRLYAHQLLEQPLGAARLPIDLSEVRNEVDAALRNTTEMMSQVTNLRRMGYLFFCVQWANKPVKKHCHWPAETGTTFLHLLHQPDEDNHRTHRQYPLFRYCDVCWKNNHRSSFYIAQYKSAPKGSRVFFSV